MKSNSLSNITVLDFSRILSGPFCTMLLADLGASVIKIERPITGDEARHLGPMVDNDSAYFISVNRGKKSVTVDITKKQGTDICLALIDKTDVLVENYSPGTMKRFNLDYETIHSRNPRLVYASLSGFGQSGPYADNPALDIIVQAMGGMMSITGEPGGDPIRPGASLGDSIAGLFTGMAILTALYQREVTNLGSYIDTSMLDCQITILENAFARYFATGITPTPMGSRHPAAVPFEAFKTKDGYIVVAIIANEHILWKRFCKAIEQPELSSDHKYKDNASRVTRYTDLKPIFAKAFKMHTTQQWISKLSPLGIACAPVQTIDQVPHHPQIKHRGMIANIPHKTRNRWSVANTPFNIDGVKSSPSGGSPELGEHTEDVLKNMLGLSSTDIDNLRSSKVI